MENTKPEIQHLQALLNAVIDKKKINSVAQKLQALNRITQVVLNEFESIRSNKTLHLDEDKLNFYDEVKRFEIELILFALIQNKGNQRDAANMLGLKFTTINSKIKRYGILTTVHENLYPEPR